MKERVWAGLHGGRIEVFVWNSNPERTVALDWGLMGRSGGIAVTAKTAREIAAALLIAADEVDGGEKK